MLLLWGTKRRKKKGYGLQGRGEEFVGRGEKRKAP